MQCVQAPAVVLKRIASIPHSDEDRERERNRRNEAKMIAGLSCEELGELLDKLATLKRQRQHNGNDHTPP